MLTDISTTGSGQGQIVRYHLTTGLVEKQRARLGFFRAKVIFFTFSYATKGVRRTKKEKSKKETAAICLSLPFFTKKERKEREKRVCKLSQK
ncbi:MAG: hypothetical protein ACI3VS_04610 [Evtepia sp.]